MDKPVPQVTRLNELKESYLEHVRQHGELTFGVQELLQIAFDLQRQRDEAVANLQHACEIIEHAIEPGNALGERSWNINYEEDYQWAIQQLRQLKTAR